jgi:hypothetical protein
MDEWSRLNREHLKKLLRETSPKVLEKVAKTLAPLGIDIYSDTDTNTDTDKDKYTYKYSADSADRSTAIANYLAPDI